MTFKHDWEKTDTLHSLPSNTIESMVKQAYPDEKLISFKIISGGCANLNIKIFLENVESPSILRIYLRDKEAAFREQKMAARLKQTAPVPLTYYIGDYEKHRFAVTQFIEGISLRDLLLSDSTFDLKPIMHEVGSLLAKIANQSEITSADQTSQAEYLMFAKKCLTNPTVSSQLGNQLISDIQLCLEKYQDAFPKPNERNLVHADFGPENILVNKINDTWRVTGILDWEFSFFGSTLLDVANMLRYAHHMPASFEAAFLAGLQVGGINLPHHWCISVHMLNLLALLDCLMRSNPQNQPKQCKDIKDLLTYIVNQLRHNNERN